MKKFIKFTCGIVFALFILAGCKKEANDDTNPVQNNVPPAFIAATSPGLISITANSLIIKPVATANVNAKLSDSYGVLISPQPAFQYVSDNTDVATVNSSGLVTGVSAGSAVISVTDGVHGMANVVVRVVEASEIITTHPVSINFSQSILSLDINTSKTFSFTLRDANGNSIAGSAALTISPSAGISISGNTITATQQGVYYVSAVSNTNDTLSGSLTVIVNDPNSPSNITTCTGTDADWEVLSVKILNCPSMFAKTGLTAAPLRVEVTRRKKCGAHDIEVIQRSPDAITLGFPGVVNLSNDGRIISVKEGISTVVATVGGVKSLAGASMVLPHLDGSYSYTGSFENSSLSGVINLSFSWPRTIVYQEIVQNNQIFKPPFLVPSGHSSGCGTIGSDVYKVTYAYVYTVPDCNYNLDNGGLYFHGNDCGSPSGIKGITGMFWLGVVKETDPLSSLSFTGDLKGSNSFTVYKNGTSQSLGSLAPGGSAGSCTTTTCPYDNSLTNGSSRTWISGNVHLKLNKNGTGSIIVIGSPDPEAPVTWSHGSGCNYPANIRGTDYVMILVDDNTLSIPLDESIYH